MKPLTDGELLDLAGARLTKSQRDRVKSLLDELGAKYVHREDGSLLAFAPGLASQEPQEPDYAGIFAERPVRTQG